MNQKEFRRGRVILKNIKYRNQLFSQYEYGCLVSIKPGTSGSADRWRGVVGRLIQINDNKIYRYAKPGAGERWDAGYRFIPCETMGIYVGRHDAGACILIEEGIYRVEIDSIIRIKTEVNK